MHPRARILTKGDTAGPEVPYFIGIENGQLFVGLRVRGTPHVVSFDLRGRGVSANMCHHVAATLNAQTRELGLYLDGARVARTTVASLSAGNLQPLSIGRSGPASGNYWKGALDDIRIWDVVRTPEQIAAAFRIELAGPQPGLVGNWQFNEGRGIVAADTAGVRQDALVIGEAAWLTIIPQR